MNIKSILPNNSVLESKAKVNPNKEVGLRQSGDRDANGREQRQGDDHPERPLTPEEIHRALEILKELPGLQASSLKLRLVSNENRSLILVEGPNGELIRRLTEIDLWQVLQNQSKKTGQFLDKAM